LCCRLAKFSELIVDDVLFSILLGPEEGECIGSTLLPGYSVSACDKDDNGIARKFAFKVGCLLCAM
jgi:hypothetical protein